MRKTPYTEIGVRRLKCFRCGKRATQQWTICADGNQYRPLCNSCDVELNDVVLEFMRHPDRDRLMAEYRGRR